MLITIKLLVAVTALGELWLFSGFTNLPSDPMGLLAILGGLTWLLSPLVALALAASQSQLQHLKKVTLLICSLLSAAVAIWFLGPWVSSSAESQGGLEVLVIPALQWLVVIAGLLTLGALTRRQRANAART
jgi:hypothetical protein